MNGNLASAKTKQRAQFLLYLKNQIFLKFVKNFTQVVLVSLVVFRL